MDRRNELRELVIARACGPGVTASALPGLRFNHAERPSVLAPKRAPALALAVIAQGAKVCKIGRRAWQYDAETFLVFTGEVQYAAAVVEASRARPYMSMSLQLPADEVVRTLVALGAQPGDAAPVDDAPAFASRLDAPLADALCRLLHTLDDAEERRVIAPLVLSELVFRLLRSDAAGAIRQAASRHGDQARIDQAMAFMRANLGRRLSVAAVARHVAMSPSHFAHRFREVARTSPIHYLKQARMHEARVSLLQGGSPAEIAARVGYQSAAHFSRDFKSYFELPPAAYARQFRAIAGSGKTIAGAGIAADARAT